MRLAWLCYDGSYEYANIEIKFEEPDRGRYDHVIPIVYAELKKDD